MSSKYVALKALFAVLSGSAICSSSSVLADDALSDLLKKYQPPSSAERPKATPRKSKSSAEAQEAKKKSKTVRKDPAESARSEGSERAVASIATEESASQPSVEEASKDVPSGLLGDWGGFKPKMEEAGVGIEIGYKADLVKNFRGGVEQDSGFLGNLDLKADFDFEKIAGFSGTSLHLYGLGDHGSKPTEFIGDSLGTSNIEAPTTFKLYEAYLAQSFEKKFELSLGFLDLNARYYVTDTSGIFRNGSFGISAALAQTGVNGPSIFPNAAFAVHTAYTAENGFYFQSGVFNATAGDPDQPYGTHPTWTPDNGYLLIWESGVADDDEKTAHKYALGAWTYSDRQDAVDPTEGRASNWGAYLLLDQKFDESVSGFFRYGFANPSVNAVAHGVETGVTWTGPLSVRPEDTLGFGVAYAQASSQAQSNFGAESFEAALELAYRLELGHGIAFVPDLQYVINPAFNKKLSSATVGTLRFEVTL